MSSLIKRSSILITQEKTKQHEKARQAIRYRGIIARNIMETTIPSVIIKEKKTQTKRRSVIPKTNPIVLTTACAMVIMLLLRQITKVSPHFVLESIPSSDKRRKSSSQDLQVPPLTLSHEQVITSETSSCALLFFGLPRAFKSLVLPSLGQNVLQTNPNCDIYVHYYNQTHDRPGRSGKGGIVYSDDLYLLEQYPHKVFFHGETEEEFMKQRGHTLEKVLTEKDSQGRPLYFPWNEGTYSNATVENLVKMWHSIESAWQLMENEATKRNVQYEKVAVLRSDVVYLTPIHLNEYTSNDTAVIPGFGRHPVSDRMVYGPYEAIRVWASERFKRLDEHAQMILEIDEGRAMHSETFLNRTIFPAMREVLGNPNGIVEHPTHCFLRARADETVWVSDCDYDPKRPKVTLPSISEGIGNVVNRLEEVLGRRCNGLPHRIKHGFKAINCARLSPFSNWYHVWDFSLL